MIRIRISRSCTIVVLSAVLSCATASTGVAQVQSKSQRNCIVAMNKTGAAIAKQQGKANAACVIARGKQPNIDVDQCVSEDPKGKIAPAAAKLSQAERTKCDEQTPDFGYAGSDLVSTASQARRLAIARDVFGASLSDGVANCDDERDRCKCHAAVAKAIESLADKAFRVFLQCKTKALQPGKLPFEAGAIDATDLAACIDAQSVVASLAADEKQTLQKATTKLASVIEKKCADAGSTQMVFAGACASASSVAECLRDRIDCRVCEALEWTDSLTVDCDTFDDGMANASCDGEFPDSTEAFAVPGSDFTDHIPFAPANADAPDGVLAMDREANVTDPQLTAFDVHLGTGNRFAHSVTVHTGPVVGAVLSAVMVVDSSTGTIATWGTEDPEMGHLDAESPNRFQFVLNGTGPFGLQSGRSYPGSFDSVALAFSFASAGDRLAIDAVEAN